LVVILGMHRSGTSVITRALQVMGIELGDNFLRPNRHNERGYWEDVDIQALNVEMLHAIDSDWHHLASISETDVHTLQNLGFEDRAAELLYQKMDSAQVFGFKDPRITKLLPFWKNVFKKNEIDVSYVLAIRNPLSVALSLEKRDGLSRIHCFYLWLEYNVAALIGGTGSIHAVIDYDRFLQSPTPTVRRISEQLALPFDRAKMATFESDFLNISLSHSTHHMEEFLDDASCPGLVQEAYTNLLQLSDGKLRLDDSQLQTRISCWIDELARTQSLMGHADSLLRKIEIGSAPPIAQSLYDIGRSISRKMPFSGWIKKRFLS